ncbi:muconolactone Delta-isomerase family protein [Klebsiella pneumoniae]|uniref:muconolactone Delta-isomerase n=8 Tax=Enterobacterales TaxID=91347 RepID=UPI001CF4A0AF|nr:muconolactone Delta-isomerase family protein [Klebsiella pneumoniae]MCM2218826.1 muconolactone Delta-isomerase family protein [Klebsiella pneumoniae]MCM2240668.1 muconolactone Delta-isomerase family protein [Klebsiella pneumoniae]MDY1602529.1 muconolactone Delta-isomerase family protein [Klebsiella pneumoniae]MDY1613233.1 muconolactone Delta-isomerase family protein [Klebsiella pneumoniae]MDY1712189.1 muconolactone Delta-isomerase family protein [Klebsiella pneumoniae]
MLFKVEMTVNIPPGFPANEAEEIKQREKAYSQQLQREGKWRHIWRVAGLYANVSIFDVQDAEELHQILMGLPLYPFGNDSNLLIVFYVQIVPDDFVMQLHRF